MYAGRQAQCQGQWMDKYSINHNYDLVTEVLMERRRMFPQSFPHRSERQPVLPQRQPSGSSSPALSTLLAAPVRLVEGIYKSVASSLQSTVSFRSPKDPHDDSKNSSNHESDIPKPTSDVPPYPTLDLADPYLGLPAPKTEADAFFLERLREEAKILQKQKEFAAMADQLDEQVEEDYWYRRETRRQAKMEELERRKQRRAHEESVRRQRAGRRTDRETRLRRNAEQRRDRTGRQRRHPQAQEAARPKADTAQQERERKQAKRERERIAQIFAWYERRWGVLTSLPFFDLVRFEDFPWPCLEKARSFDDITLGNVYSFVFHPDRPGVAKMDRIAILNEELKRWHPDTFDTTVLPSIQDCPAELAADIKEGFYRVYHWLDCFDSTTDSSTPRSFTC